MNDKVKKMEELKKRHQKLKERKISIDVEISSNTKMLEQARQEARELFGTDNLTELRQKLTEFNARNEALEQEFVKTLDAVEQELAAAEKELGLTNQ